MDIVKVIVDIILAVVPIIVSSVLVPWLKASLDAKQLEKAIQYVDIAVSAAEQIGLVNGHDGTWKKDYVLAYLASKGINLDMETLDNLIEASVLLLRKELEA